MKHGNAIVIYVDVWWGFAEDETSFYFPMGNPLRESSLGIFSNSKSGNNRVGKYPGYWDFRRSREKIS
jgi:hypothetical protein